MKTKLITLLLLLTIAGQAMSMGHPHNLFAARKQMKAKVLSGISKSKASANPCQQLFATIDKTEFAKRLVTAFTTVRPVRSY